MFQNINMEPEEMEEEISTKKTDKKALLKENFKIQNIILYILAFRRITNRLRRAE